MDNGKLVLADGMEITLEDSHGIGTLVIGEASRSEECSGSCVSTAYAG